MIFINNNDRKLIDTLKVCLKHCDECKIAVAYVRNSGINPIIDDIESVLRTGGKVKLLTSNQMGITESEAIESLFDIGVEIKIFINPNKIFHPKAYIFKGIKKSEYIIGSSNLSRSALFDGIEWNLHFDSSNPISSTVEDNFDRIWCSNETQIITRENLNSLFKNHVEEVIRDFVKREDVVITTLFNTLTDLLAKNICYPVSKRPDNTTTWKFNLSVNKVNRLLEKNNFYVIVRCDYESTDEVVFAIASEYLTRNIFPYANQGNSSRYLFEVNKRTFQFNWQRSIKMDGKPFIIQKARNH